MTSASPANDPEVSVVVVTWNSSQYVRDCLRSVLRSAGPTAVELIVVDNRSEDGTPDIVAREFPAAVLLRNETNRGLTAANNQGADRTRGAFVMFLNPDTTLPEGALPGMLRVLARTPELGALAPRLVDERGRLSHDMGHRAPTARTVFNSFFFLSRLSQRLFPGIHRTRDVRGLELCDWACGACLLVRRPVVDSVCWGEFGLGDDFDYCSRIRAAGWHLGLTGDVQVVHYAGRSWTKARPRTLGGTASRIAVHLYQRGWLEAAAGITAMRVGLRFRAALHGTLHLLTRDPERLYKAQKVRQFLAHDDYSLFTRKRRPAPDSYPG